MATDMYDDSGGADNPGTATKSEKKDKGAATALLPKSFFPSDKPLEVGNTCTIKIERVLDGQVSVSYSHSAEEPEVEEEEEIVAEEPMSDLMA